MTKTRSSEVVTGEDILSVQTFRSTELGGGSVLAQYQISPRAFHGTRLAQMASMWNRWCPIHLTFTARSTAPTIAGGIVAAAWSSDDKELLPRDQVSLVRKLGVLPHVQQGAFWQPIVVNVTEAPVQRWLYTDLGQDDTFHGCFILVCVGAPSSITGTVDFTVSLKWTVRFEAPDIITSHSEPTIVVRADDGYDPYFTTFSGSVNNSKLTLECASAGGYSSIVRFSAMVPGVVYEPASDTLSYYKKSGATYTTESVGALVRMKERPEPFVWCFASKDEANEYLKTSDISHVLDYAKAGPWSKTGMIWKPAAEEFGAPAPQELRVLTEDKAVRRGLDKALASLRPLIDGLAESVKSLTERINQMPLGTTLDPVKVFVEDPILSAAGAVVARSPDVERFPVAWASRPRMASASTDTADFEMVEDPPSEP